MLNMSIQSNNKKEERKKRQETEMMITHTHQKKMYAYHIRLRAQKTEIQLSSTFTKKQTFKTKYAK